MNLSETDVKLTCKSFLDSMQNMGRLVWFRLNAGGILTEGKGGKKYMIRLCPPGTSDSVVILPNPTRVIFVEYKRPGKKQSEAQIRFDKEVAEQHHSYWIVEDADAFIEAIREELRIKSRISARHHADAGDVVEKPCPGRD